MNFLITYMTSPVTVLLSILIGLQVYYFNHVVKTPGDLKDFIESCDCPLKPQTIPKKNDAQKPPEINFRPIIGILAQSAIGVYGNFSEYMIFGAHTKWVQMGGANVVPIWGNKSMEYYENIIKQINGIYLPGGHSNPIYSLYGNTAKILLELAIKENDNGHYFPVWATCLGIQFLLSHSCNEVATYTCEEMYKQTTFYAGKDFDDSFIAKNVPRSGLRALFNETYLPHMHHNCVSLKKYHECPEAEKFYKVVSVNTDDNGTEYISTIQARNYPIYAVQWHPEKFSYHWNKKASTPHTLSSIRLGQTLGNFFITEARRNDHKFFDPTEEEASLIDNYRLEFIGHPGYASFYFFNENQTTPSGLQQRKQYLQSVKDRKLEYTKIKK